MMRTVTAIALAGAVMFLALGCQKKEAELKKPAAEPPKKEETAPVSEVKPKMVPQVSQAEMQAISFKKGEKPQIKLETSLGTIVVELWPDVAPVHCKNFYYLAQKGFYDSLLVHRVISGFVLQSGDPNGDGSGGPGYSIPGEFSDNKHVKGTLSMARSQDPNSAGSQFFICLGPTPNLDTKYSVFGQTVEGMEVIDKFNQVKTAANNYGELSRPETPIYLLKAAVLTQ